MIEAMRNNENFSARGMATTGEFPSDVYQKARNIAIRAYEGDVSSSDRKWIKSGSRYSGNVTSRGEPFRGPISLGPDRKPMDGLLKRDLMKKIYADGGIARKFIHRRALEDEKIRDMVRNAEFYRSIQGLDLSDGDEEEDDEPMPQYNNQVVTDEMVEGWDPETKKFNNLTPEEEKQRFIESLNFKGLKELKQLAKSLNVEQIPDEIEIEIDELRELIISKKYPEPEMEQGDEDEYEDEDAFGGGGKSKKRRNSKKRKSKRRKSKRRKTRRKKR